MQLTEQDHKNLKTIGLREHVCFVCGKTFECRGEYAYKKYTSRTQGTEYYCSYTCMRKAEKGE